MGITGAILTKMDGDSRGGAALSVRGVSGKPIKFVGVGEGMDDLEPFSPERMASRRLGMGDVATLLEKAQVMRNIWCMSGDLLYACLWFATTERIYAIDDVLYRTDPFRLQSMLM